jgi:GAF domain-containing protein
MNEEGHLSREAVDGLAMVATSDPDAIVERALNVARELLGMDIGYVAEFKDGKQVYAGVEGDGDSFGMTTGGSYPLEGSYCRRMTLGRIGNIVPDARAEAETRDLELTAMANIGAYIGVPIQFSDGTLYGTICCASHDAHGDLDDRDIRFMQVLARVVGGELEQRALVKENQALKETVRELRVEIDQAQKEQHVTEITESEWFRELRARAAELRAR